MYYYTFNGTDPLTWPNTNTYYTSTYLPNLKLRVERTIPVVPSNVTLTSGVWSGNLTLGATGTNLTLTADTAAGLTGESNVFSSVAVAALAVTPAGPVSTAGYRGGPFTPLAHTFTVTNGGSGAMSWTASNATPWLSLSLSGGTLASGASTSVVATLDASQLAVMPSGSASAVVSFANTTNGIGNTTRVIQLSVNAHGQLVITPGAGGNYTLTNSGDAALNWTLAADAWLSATPTSGTLAIGATASVSVTPGPLAALLAKGHYEGALVSTNTSTGHGNATLTFMHDVLSPAPVLQPEPPITGGTTNTISWVPAPSALEGEAQAATDAGFTAPQNSGVVAAVAHTFASVAEGLHYYRARARELLRNMSAWGQGTPAALGAGTKTNVIADATGIVLVNSPGGPIAGRIVNESFETDSLGSTSATSWAKSSSPAMFFIVEQYSQGAPLPTDGTKYAVLYTGWSVTHVVGESISISQTIDFTGSTQLVFDSTLTKTTSWMNAIRAEVKIDGTSVWSKTTEGSATNQAVNVSSLSGVHVVSLECSVILGGVYDPQWACFDNLRLNGIGGYASSGNLVSAPISRSLTGWGQLLYTADTPAGSGLTVDVLDSANAVLATAVPNGTDLNNIPAVAAQTSIRLRANLTSTNTAVTPRLRNWLVTSVGALATVPTAGPWSNVVASTQDATGPAITRTSALAVGSASYIPGGSALDLAGVQSLTVNGIAATTTNAFATWIAPAITLTEGANTLTVTASDNAVPPNTTTATWTVTLATDTDGDRLPDAWEIANGFDPNDGSNPQMNGDGDGDGINNLLEFALALDPQRADGAPCSTTIEVNPADGLRYMVYHYRRRAALQTWGFDIQTGTAPGTWTGLAATEEAAPPTVHADAVGETLHLRILPALGGSAAGFYRLRVTAP